MNNRRKIAGLVIERAGLIFRGKDRLPRVTFDVVLPLVGVGMPVQLAHAAGLDFDERSRDFRRNLEVLRVRYPEMSHRWTLLAAVP